MALRLNLMKGNVSVLIEKDECGYYVWCPHLIGCQSQGANVAECLANISEAIELYLETFTEAENI